MHVPLAAVNKAQVVRPYHRAVASSALVATVDAAVAVHDVVAERVLAVIVLLPVRVAVTSVMSVITGIGHGSKGEEQGSRTWPETKSALGCFHAGP